ncbi:hypothetical protein CPAV1605_1456 [seawater metagenome]|uniref:LysM domain-containing protein n=1 Tax=seawater metagenome TaxID=1561972 RepID=A0A5E8CKE6_9ZZZZ
MQYTTRQLYCALSEAETGIFSDKFIRTRVRGSKSSAYGPVQLTGGKRSIINRIIKKKINIEINDDEFNYLLRFKKQASLFLRYGDKKNLAENLVKYDYGGEGDLNTISDRFLYKSVALKIIEIVYKENNYNFNKFVRAWRGKNVIFKRNGKIVQSEYYKKIKNYLSSPSLNCLVNISEVIDNSNKLLSLEKNNIIGKATDDKTKLKGCAYYIRILVNKTILSSWHCHNFNRKYLIYSAFNNKVALIKNQLTNYFNKINKDPSIDIEDEVKKLLLTIAPNKDEYVNYLKEGNVVGLFFKKSDYHKEALFEGACNWTIFNRIKLNQTLEGIARKNKCDIEDLIAINKIANPDVIVEGQQIVIPSSYNHMFYGEGRFYENNNKNWQPEDLGKDLKFTPAKIFSDKNCFGFNTHIGIVAKIGLNKMILHYVGNDIYLTPIDSLKPNFYLMWVMNLFPDN